MLCFYDLYIFQNKGRMDYLLDRTTESNSNFQEIIDLYRDELQNSL